MQDISSIFSLERLSSDGSGSSSFQSTHPPSPLNRAADSAFGGSTLAFAIQAAYHTLKPEQVSALRLYSVLGHFHGSTRCSVPVRLTVTSLRDTRSFATRQVTVTQPDVKAPDKLRTRSVILIDFVAKAGDKTVVSFSTQPRLSSLSHHSALRDFQENFRDEVKDGTISKKLLTIMSPFYRLHDHLDNRYCPEGMLGQESIGLRLDVTTNQEALPYAQRTSYDWLKSRTKLPVASSPTENASATKDLLPPTVSAASASLFAHFLDTWMSVVAPWFAHLDASKVQTFATLDFALRIHVDELDATAWHLREHTADSAQDERNYVQAHLWRETTSSSKDASAKGDLQLVATMTQTCVMRGPPKKGGGPVKGSL